jgi:hypothetical protein
LTKKLTVSKVKSLLGSTRSFELSLSDSGPRILIDENVASLKLTVALLKLRFRVIFLGKKKHDDVIVNYLHKSSNSDVVMVTKDRELESRIIGYTQSLLLTGRSLKEDLHLIQKFTSTAKNI